MGERWRTAETLHGLARPASIERAVREWRQEEARETLREIARQEGYDWLVQEVVALAAESLPGKRPRKRRVSSV